MIRSTIASSQVRRFCFTSSVLVMSLTLSSCMTSQKQAAIVDDTQDVAAILPPASPETMTGTIPRDPKVAQNVPNAAERIAPVANANAGLQQAAANNGVLAQSADTPVPALGIMQSTRVNAGSGSIFSSLTNDQAAFDPNDPIAVAANGTAVKPVKKSLFSMVPQSNIAPQLAPQSVEVIVPPASVSGDPTKDPNYDAGIVVMHRQTDEERRVMADKNDLVRNAHPQIRAMEPDAQAAPANNPTSPVKVKKKPWSLKDMFGELGKSAGTGKSTSTQ